MTTRQDPPHTAPERESLLTWLQYHRDTLAEKCDGLSPQQLCDRAVPPSSISLIGLVRHMAEVERHWFRRLIAGDGPDVAGPIYYDNDTNPDGDFDDVDPESVDHDFDVWRAEMASADGIIAGIDDLDETRHSPRGIDISMRWVLTHMIEEYARHNGHADFLRERIDGTTGE